MAMNTPFYSAYYDEGSNKNDALVEAALVDVMSGTINSSGVNPTSAAAAALKKTQGNTGMFAQEFLNNNNKVDSAMSNRRNLQEGGPTLPMMDGAGNLPPEVVADDVVNGAPMGMVDVPSGGGPVDDGVPTELPEGTFVLNAAAIQYHGTETIDKLINDAVRALLKEGVQISAEDPNPDDDVPVAISNGEYVIPPEVAEKIGYKKLEDMNERGLEYRKKQEEAQKKQAEAEAKQQPPPQPPQQPQETFMGLQMPPEQAGPPQAPVQSEQQAMAMMGMANGGPVADGLGTAIKAVTEFVNSFLGGSMDSSQDTKNKQIDALLAKPSPVSSTEPYYPPEVREPNSGYTEMAPSVVTTAQQPMLQQGGFVENYTYAQPQQTTLGTPFPNAATSNPQQYGSFVQPNKQRVNADEGKKIVRPALPPMTTDNISVSSQIQNTLNSLRVGLPDDDPKALELDSIIKNYQENRIIPQGYGFIEKYKDYIYPVVPDKEPSPSIEPAPEKTPAPIVPLRSNDRTAANGGFIKLQNGDKVKKKDLVRPLPKEKPPVPPIDSLASLKDTPREQRYGSSQDADTQALTDTFFAEQQRGPSETELDQIVEGIAKQSAAAAVGYGDGDALYGMPDMKGEGLNSLGITSPDAKRAIETAPPFASSLSSFIPPRRKNLWTAVVNMGREANKIKGLSSNENRIIRHELEHIAYQKIPNVHKLFRQLKNKHNNHGAFGRSEFKSEEGFIRVKDYMVAYANNNEKEMEKTEYFLKKSFPTVFTSKGRGFTPLDFYKKNKHIFDAVDRLAQVYLKNSGGKLAGMTPGTEYSEEELQVDGMPFKTFFRDGAPKNVSKLYNEAIRIMTESPTADFIQQEARSDGGFIKLQDGGKTKQKPGNSATLKDFKDISGIRPLNKGEYISNLDGGDVLEKATEYSRTIPANIEGQWMNVPSIWMTSDGAKRFDSEDDIFKLVQNYEKKTNTRFPLFNSLDEAEIAAQDRSNKGAVFSGPLAKANGGFIN